MAASSLAINRRDRRRRQIAILLTLAVVVTVIGLAMSYRTEQRETTEYLALVGDVTRSELAVAESLQDLFASLNTLDRPAILGRIDTIAGQAARIDEMFAGAVVTRPVANVHGFVAVSLDSWHQAIYGLDEAVIEIMDQQEAFGADGFSAELLEEAFLRLRIGDEAFAGALRAAADLDPELEAPAYPSVVFIDPERIPDVEAIAQQLRQSRNLEERRDVEVTANTSPEPTGGSTTGILAMPFSETLNVTAVVTNSGNVLQEGIDVTLELRKDGAAGDPVRESRIITTLSPQSSETMEFVSLALEPGGLYTLQITVDIPDDANVENNVWKITFATNTG